MCLVNRMGTPFANIMHELEDLAHNMLDPGNGLGDAEVAESLQIIKDLSGIPYNVLVENLLQILVSSNRAAVGLSRL